MTWTTAALIYIALGTIYCIALYRAAERSPDDNEQTKHSTAAADSLTARHRPQKTATQFNPTERGQ